MSVLRRTGFGLWILLVVLVLAAPPVFADEGKDSAKLM